jgi:signal transduction histidine kinase
MAERGPPWLAALAWLSLVAATLLLETALALSLTRPTGLPRLALSDVLWWFRFFSFPLVGAIIAAMRPRHPIGWLLLALGLLVGGQLVLSEWARRLYATEPQLGATIFLIGDQLNKALFLDLFFLLLVFPSGRFPSRRWRWLAGLLVATAVFAILRQVTAPGSVPDMSVPRPPANPWSVPALGFLWPLDYGFSAYLLLLVAAAASVVLRFRGADGELRQQLKWFTFAAVFFGVVTLAAAMSGLLPAWTQPALDTPLLAVYFLATVALAAAIAVAILRHRLFDIDLVISRTVTYVALAALITVFYVAVIAGVGALVGAGSPSRLALSVVATAVVAVVFQPLRARLQHLANRLVYGDRASPYEALANFTDRLQRGAGLEEPMEHMARALAEGTGARSATVWLRRNGQDVPAATCPPAASAPSVDSVARSAPIRDGGEILGRLSVSRPEGGLLSPTEERLMDSLALHAGLFVRNASLDEELRRRLEELRTSRQRLISAQDEERRRLERDLHDGAQQALIAVRMKLGLAEALAGDMPAELRDLLHEIQEEMGEAVDSVRALARGVFPPLLEAQGLRAALTARARRSPVPLEISCPRERFPREVEGTIYFCCAEAVQNLVKHSGAGRGEVRVWKAGRRLSFEVCDGGRGFDVAEAAAGAGLQNMRDRLEALGGSLEVRARPEEGTRLGGWVPLTSGVTAGPAGG